MEKVIRCPFCGDHPRHNHCYINEDKGVFHCFFCGRGGPINRLPLAVRRSLSLGWLDTAQSVSEAFVSSIIPLQPLIPEVRNQYIAYLFSRGLRPSDIHLYRPMFSPAYPQRVFFPVFRQQKVVFWTARLIVESETEPKWLLPKRGTTRYRASDIVWGAEFLEDDLIFICEGVFDAIALKGVAIFGKRLHQNQLRLLLRLRPRALIVAFDADAREEAGRTAEEIARLVPPDIDTGYFLPERGDWGDLLLEHRRRKPHTLGSFVWTL